MVSFGLYHESVRNVCLQGFLKTKAWILLLIRRFRTFQSKSRKWFCVRDPIPLLRLQVPLFVLPPPLCRNIPNILECPLKASDFVFPGLALQLLLFLLLILHLILLPFRLLILLLFLPPFLQRFPPLILQLLLSRLRRKLNMSILVWFMAGIQMCGNCTFLLSPRIRSNLTRRRK